MKKRISILAIALAAGCAVGLAGCSKGGVNVANLNSNWFTDTKFKPVQPTFLEEENREEITYDVTYTPAQHNLGYTLSYDNGTYTTLFKAVKIAGDVLRDITDAEYNREGFTEAVENAGGDGITAYYYETNYAISGKFTYSGKDDAFNDSTVTKCYFLSVGESLRPLYSSQVIKSTSPSNGGVYKKLDLEYECFYKFNGSAVKTYITDNSKAENKTTSKTASLGGAANTLFDETYFNIAVRATRLSAGSSLSQTVSLYSPADGIGNFTLKGSDSKLTLAKDADANAQAITALTDKLTAAGLFKPQTPAEGETAKGLSTVAVNVTYNGELSGVSQTYWFAAVENTSNNTGRATMLKVSSPLPFGLGTLDFTLSEITSTFWNN